MNTNSAILAVIESLVREVIHDDLVNLTLESKASDIDGWDSLAHVTILVHLEQQYSMKLSLSELQNTNNIGDLVQLIKSKIN